METAETTIPHVDTTRVTVTRENGSTSSIFMDVKDNPLPQGSFAAESTPERILKALGRHAEGAVRIDVAQTRIPTRGPGYSGD